MPEFGISMDSANEHSLRPKPFLRGPWSLHPTPISSSNMEPAAP